jgi:hypothetical protein
MELTDSQLELIEAPLNARIFLEGPAGCGKTTTGTERLLYLLSRGVRGDQILILVPQRTLASPYYSVLHHPEWQSGGMVSVLTVGGLAQRMVELFWPLVAERAGFAHPELAPVFLTLETAQYYMARIVRPLFAQGYFASVTLDHNRLYSQIIDNLNKSAVVGFPFAEIGSRLKESWIGEGSQTRVYDDAQECATRFRQYCLAQNLLDFSLQMELFQRYLWDEPTCHNYLLATYRHLITDNLEEDTPAAHRLLQQWLPYYESALLIYDHDAGYRIFLGADPEGVYEIKNDCSKQAVFLDSFVSSPALRNFAVSLDHTLDPNTPAQPYSASRPKGSSKTQSVQKILEFDSHRFYPQMFMWVADEVEKLVRQEGVPPGEITILAPFLTDALRFSLANRLELLDIPVRSHRPSRALREEPGALCLLTIAALAHPDWGLRPTQFDVAYALVQSIGGLDLVRAQLLAEITYRFQEGKPRLASFETIRPEMQLRITYHLGGKYETLRRWIELYMNDPAEQIDFFFSRLFGEVLSQPGFGFHNNFTAGEVAGNLVESARKFRWAIGPNLPEDGLSLGQEYIEMVQDGVVAAQYLQSWQAQTEEAVLIAPAYTFLLSNHPTRYQFWLDIGSRGWFERLYQPLTHPYVLSSRWPRGAPWTDTDEVRANQDVLRRLALGLVRRCKEKIYLGLCELNEQGFEHQGPLLKAIQRVLRQEG